ncbi:MAG: dTDP-4-dehydrorhamnose reductase [Pseudomonadota bacterium]
MKILLLGKNGQVGWELQRSLAPLGEVVALDFDSPGTLQADFSKPDSLAATVQAVAPDLIVNAAAYTVVDKAESEPDLARRLNATAVGVIAREAAARQTLLVHYSTDYIFNGEGESPWIEDAAPQPLSVYGQTKLEGENLIRESGCPHLILRTSWVYGARGGNFIKTMLRLAKERDQLTVIDDQIGAPTGADLLADLTAHMVRTAQGGPSVHGTYHAAAAGYTSWYAYAQHVIEFARAAGQPIQVKPEAILAVPTTHFPTPARRPLNSRLDTTKLRNTFKLTLPHWEAGVERMLREFLG